MKIACDVKGTLEGPKKRQIIRILDALSRNGHQIIVWSNLGDYAAEAVRDNNLKAIPMTKKMMCDYDDPSEAMDLAIEDDQSQTSWLGAKSFLLVEDIPEDSVQLDFLIREILEGQ